MTNLAHLPEHPKPRRAAGRQALVIIGAAGGLAIEPLDERDGAPSAEEQLAARAKRLYPKQRAQLVVLTVLAEISA